MAKYRAGRVRQEILREVNNILLLEIKDPRVECYRRFTTSDNLL